MKEILKTTGDKSVESSLGWKVEILSINSLRYSEEGHAIKLEMEDRPDTIGELEWIIYLPDNWSWPGRNDDSLSEGKISEILKRIELAFWKLDMKIREIV